MSALIIDDDPITVKILGLQLAQINVVAIPARDIEEAMKILETVPVKMIFLDLFLPGIDGFQFLIQRSNNAALSSIPVIVISCAADLDTISKAVTSGANSYLIKPVQIKLLLDTLVKMDLKVL